MCYSLFIGLVHCQGNTIFNCIFYLAMSIINLSIYLSTSVPFPICSQFAFSRCYLFHLVYGTGGREGGREIFPKFNKEKITPPQIRGEGKFVFFAKMLILGVWLATGLDLLTGLKRCLLHCVQFRQIPLYHLCRTHMWGCERSVIIH